MWVIFRVTGGTMAWRIGLAVGFLCLGSCLGGCASVGNESIADASVETVSHQLTKGKTTQEQVRQLYGDPMKSSFTDSGNETWEYEFSRLRSKPTNFVPYVNIIYSGAEGDKKSLVIFFDKRKIVQQYTVSTSQVDISRGLFTR
jgi:outer membrane protein assembly factor BamE (lipoprotein component of BamABCDE complex)